ncbi:zinc ribbon domain-containing protein [Chryseolinea lacunae]
MRSTLADIQEHEPPTVSKEQQAWISDAARCDACGHAIEPRDKICPDCGIRLG